MMCTEPTKLPQEIGDVGHPGFACTEKPSDLRICGFPLCLRSYFALTFRAFFFLAGRMRTGFFLPPFFLVAVEAARSAMSLVPLGEPRPVHASQPGPAEKAPLFPETMSLNAEAAFAA